MIFDFLYQRLTTNIFCIFAVSLFLIPHLSYAQTVNTNSSLDSDSDGLNDQLELKYATNPTNPDTDGDGYQDGNEVFHGYDPLVPGTARLPKRIDVNLTEQRLRYYYGEYGEQGTFLISSGRKGYLTPPGSYTVLKKLPTVTYSGIDRGKKYNYPNTKWNLRFLPGYYIHGTFWHNNFGHPMSHGCINVSYANIENLYNFADIGTPVTIHY